MPADRLPTGGPKGPNPLLHIMRLGSSPTLGGRQTSEAATGNTAHTLTSSNSRPARNRRRLSRQGLIRGIPERTLRVGTLNMRTCQNSAQACSLAAELQEAGVHICGLQEVRRKGCKRENLPNGWAFLWSGPTSPTAKRERGVGALLSPTAAKSLVGFYPWPGMEDRIMAMIFSGPVMTTVLVTYAPTNTATQAIKDTYYAQLSLAEKTHAPPSNMLIILADMNAKVGQDVEAWPGIIGGFGGLSTTRPPSPPPLPSPPLPLS